MVSFKELFEAKRGKIIQYFKIKAKYKKVNHLTATQIYLVTLGNCKVIKTSFMSTVKYNLQRSINYIIMS